jgi:hypothetical protein
MAGSQTILVAARDVSADRTAGQYWGLPEMSLLRGLRNSTGGCQRCLLTGPLDNTGGCQRCLPTGNQPVLGAAERCLVDKLRVIPSHCHHTMVHIANRPGMEKRPVEASVLRRHSRPIIENYQSTLSPPSYDPSCQ